MAGSSIIGQLRVILGIDSAEFVTGARKAQGALGALSGSIKSFAIGMASGLSLTAVTLALKSTIDHMDELGKTAQKIGIPVEELSKLEYAARLADVSLEQLTSSTAKFSKQLAAIQAGNKNDASVALKALGVSALDAQGKLRPTTSIIADVAEAFSKMEDGAGKTAIAIALFGKSGAQMIPLLNGGKQALLEAANEAERFGIVISEKTAKAAEDFNDNLTRLKAVGEGFTYGLAEGVLPALVAITNAMVDWVNESETAKTIGKALGDGLISLTEEILAVGAAWQTATAYMNAFGVIKEGWDQGGMMGWMKMKSAFSEAGKDSDAAWSSVADTMERLRKEIEQVNVAIDNPLKKKYTAPVLDLGGSGGGKDKQHPLYGGVMVKYVKDVVDLNQQLVITGKTIEDIEPKLKSTFGDTFKGLFDDAKDGVIDLQDHLIKLLDSLADMAIDGIIQQLLGQGGHGLYGGGGTGIMGGIMGLFDGFMADGGNIQKGHFAVVGEGGAEIVGGDGSVTPMSGGMKVNVYNYGNDKVTVNQRSESLDITIDKLVSKHLSTPGSQSNRALTKGFGLKNPSKMR